MSCDPPLSHELAEFFRQCADRRDLAALKQWVACNPGQRGLWGAPLEWDEPFHQQSFLGYTLQGGWDAPLGLLPFNDPSLDGLSVQPGEEPLWVLMFHCNADNATTLPKFSAILKYWMDKVPADFPRETGLRLLWSKYMDYEDADLMASLRRHTQRWLRQAPPLKNVDWQHQVLHHVAGWARHFINQGLSDNASQPWVEVWNQLREAGACPGALNEFGQTPLMIYLEEGDETSLFKFGPFFETMVRDTAAVKASDRGAASALDFKLRRRSTTRFLPVGQFGPEDATALSSLVCAFVLGLPVSLQKKVGGAVDLLLQNGACPHVREVLGDSVFHQLAKSMAGTSSIRRKRSMEMFERLLSQAQSKPFTSKGGEGFTPFEAWLWALPDKPRKSKPTSHEHMVQWCAWGMRLNTISAAVWAELRVSPAQEKELAKGEALFHSSQLAAALPNPTPGDGSAKPSRRRM